MHLAASPLPIEEGYDVEGDALRGSDSMFYFKAAPGPSPSPSPGPSKGGGSRDAGSGVPAGEGEKEQDQGTVWGEPREGRGRWAAGQFGQASRCVVLACTGLHSAAARAASARRLLPQCGRIGEVQLLLLHSGAL